MSQASTAGPWIFLVEDNQDDRQLLYLACRRAGLEVVWALAPNIRSAHAKLDLVRAGTLDPPELAIVDLRLPDGSGSEVVSQLVDELPAVPFVVFSNSDAPEDRALVPPDSAGEYLVKPDRFAGYDEILQRIRRALTPES